MYAWMCCGAENKASLDRCNKFSSIIFSLPIRVQIKRSLTTKRMELYMFAQSIGERDFHERFSFSFLDFDDDDDFVLLPVVACRSLYGSSSSFVPVVLCCYLVRTDDG